MCQKVTCEICGKPTWAGCGEHIEQALAGVPLSARCQGHDSPVRRAG
ncbi:hypothetical protein [Propionimicrobium sp. PCR01-08-3]|nr:hypothetical protein [Propionimicrobium sp. PCR01-08-3]WIY84047.1 hypothetical protein QQ658_06835 [Propionimicrobium sp. PCR01-08-3]